MVPVTRPLDPCNLIRSTRCILPTHSPYSPSTWRIHRFRPIPRLVPYVHKIPVDNPKKTSYT